MNIIQIQYDPLESIIRRVDRLHEIAEVHRARVRQMLSMMDSGVWVGRGAEAFTEELVQLIEPSVDRLGMALEQVSVKLREAMSRMQQAEHEGAALFNKDLVGIGFAAASAIVKSALAALYPAPDGNLRDGYLGLDGECVRPPWLTEYSEVDGGFTGAKDADVLFINGIQTDPQSHISGLIQVSQAYGNIPVTGIYNKTEGEGSGIAGDLYQSAGDWAEARFGFRLPFSGNPAVDQAVEWIRSHPDGQLVVHSQGAAITAAALMKLSREKPPFDLDNLKVTTLGGAGAKFPDGPVYRHLSFTGDHVPMATLGVNNPTMLNKHMFSPEYTTIVHEVKGDGFMDSFTKTHSMTGYLRNLENFEKVEAIESMTFGCVDPSSVGWGNMDWKNFAHYARRVSQEVKVVQ